ncbi:hypothetical protein DFP72DRAFT_847264 [Ephemerocybe angulata]|uniref:Uncharacterized protein n=1 Tax=Ephemerocybe angulata TaxID=980116 RepID=A0A8H6M5I5_9AGAR|nr:hypothetical protein DFP72DRAFT_847264 [Tulosesus angulatus]
MEQSRKTALGVQAGGLVSSSERRRAEAAKLRWGRSDSVEGKGRRGGGAICTATLAFHSTQPTQLWGTIILSAIGICTPPFFPLCVQAHHPNPTTSTGLKAHPANATSVQSQEGRISPAHRIQYPAHPVVGHPHPRCHMYTSPFSCLTGERILPARRTPLPSPRSCGHMARSILILPPPATEAWSWDAEVDGLQPP